MENGFTFGGGLHVFLGFGGNLCRCDHEVRADIALGRMRASRSGSHFPLILDSGWVKEHMV